MRGKQEPRISSYPDFDSEEKSEKVLKLISKMVDKNGKPIEPMPFQTSLLIKSCRTTGDKWSAFEVCELLGRQNGKSFGGILRVIAGLFLFNEEVVYSSHKFDTTKKLFTEMEQLIRANDFLFKRLMGYRPGMKSDEQIAGIRYANGSLSITTSKGKACSFVARSKGGGRGYSPDLVILEEAFALQQEHMDALIPSLAGNSVDGNPQVWYISSAPLPDSYVLHDIRNRGKAGTDSGLLYMEWSAPESTPEEDLLNPEIIAMANPAYGYRLSHDHVEKERDSMSVDGFKQERLGIPMITATSSLFNSADWDAQLEEFEQEPDPIDPENLVLALDIPPDRSVATITAAYLQDGRLFVEVIERREGVQWVPHVLKELSGLSAYPIIYDAKGQAGALADQFVLLRLKSRAITYPELLKASGLFFDHVTERKLFHIGQDELDQAVYTVTVKPAGDRWKFARGDADISPIVSASFALYFLLTFTNSKKKKGQSHTSTTKKRRVRI